MKNSLILLFLFIISITYSQNVSDNYSIVNKRYYYSSIEFDYCERIYVLNFDSDSSYTLTYFITFNDTIIADSAYGCWAKINENILLIKTFQYYPSKYSIIRAFNDPHEITLNVEDSLVISDNCIKWFNYNNDCVYYNSLDSFALCEKFFPFIIDFDDH